MSMIEGMDTGVEREERDMRWWLEFIQYGAGNKIIIMKEAIEYAVVRVDNPGVTELGLASGLTIQVVASYEEVKAQLTC